MKLIIEIDPTMLTGYDIRQVLATVSAEVLNGGEPIDLRIAWFVVCLIPVLAVYYWLKGKGHE